MRYDKYNTNDDIEKERYEQATDRQQYVYEVCWEMWDPRTIIPMEVGDWYTSDLKEDKDIHTVMDCSCAIDYLVDPFTEPPFGLNQRNHSPNVDSPRFDLRAKNYSNAGSELDKLMAGLNNNGIVPKYATRMNITKNGVEWFRIIHLRPLVSAIKEAGFTPSDTYTIDDDYTAWFFDYDVLKSMGAFVAEFDGNGNKIFADETHESLDGVDRAAIRRRKTEQ